jgi:hypothetical protein
MLLNLRSDTQKQTKNEIPFVDKIDASKIKNGNKVIIEDDTVEIF